ncbi:MAG TPA: porin [Gammaproteobacteria bacterium]
MAPVQRKKGSGSRCATEGALAAAITAIGFSGPAAGFDVAAGDWNLTVSGNVNVHYILADCEEETTPGVDGGLACRGSAGEERTSSISNGLLPAALAIGASTTQDDYDLSFTFGLFPGISTNDGSPNLQQGADLLNTALGTTALDIRQVFMTFGNDRIGTFKLGRDIGLFGADAILNDMTIPGVGGINGNNAAPANTALGSIGLGYIYADWIGQISYTTRDFNGLSLTIGIFDPLEPIVEGAPTPEGSPGFQGKVSYTREPFYFSATFIRQEHEGATDVADFDSLGFDVGGKVTFGDAEFLLWYYTGEGIGTTALFLLGDTGAGGERDSDGFLAQLTYTLGDTKLGVNYGRSDLDLAAGELPSALVKRNEKFTLGAYHSLTANLTLLAELTRVQSEAHNGVENESTNFNIGAFLSF